MAADLGRGGSDTASAVSSVTVRSENERDAMSGSTQDLLSPEGAVLTDPADVERALARMWAPAGAKASGEPAAKAATRICVANLIVVAPAAQWDALLEVMAELSPMMPTRTIVLLIAEDQGAPAEITASVSALCHVPRDGEAQVCCEQIVLRAGTQHVPVLDHTLLPLLEADVPVMCWWRFDMRAWPTLFSAMRSSARRIILDHPPIQQPVESSADCAVRDLGWYRTAGLRELLASLFDGCRPDAVQAIHRVDIDAGGTAAGRVEGLWLAAFLAGQLGWKPSAAEPVMEADHGRNETSFQFSSGERCVDVRIAAGANGGPGLRQVLIAGEDDRFDLERRADGENEYRITVYSRNICQTPRSVQVPPVRTSQALAAALAGRRVDAAFSRVWPIAAWMANAADAR